MRWRHGRRIACSASSHDGSDFFAVRFGALIPATRALRLARALNQFVDATVPRRVDQLDQEAVSYQRTKSRMHLVIIEA